MVEDEIARERMELTRREALYRGDRPPIEVSGPHRDPGRRRPGHRLDHAGRRAGPEAEGPGSIVVAVPTAAPSTCEEFQTIADECICTITPEPFRAVGLWYQNFEQTSDEEVIDLLARSAADSRTEDESHEAVPRLIETLDPCRAPSR